MKLAKSCFSDSEDQESSFHHCGSCDVGATLFMCGKDLITAFSPPRRCCEARVGLFKCQSKSIKRFSTLWRPREVGTSLFMCGKDLKSRFKLP